jgi:hypothetical protein
VSEVVGCGIIITAIEKRTKMEQDVLGRLKLIRDVEVERKTHETRRGGFEC